MQTTVKNRTRLNLCPVALDSKNAYERKFVYCIFNGNSTSDYTALNGVMIN
jgi:hypothetical protein